MDELTPSGDDQLSLEFSHENDGSPTVKLGGELDLATVNELETALKPMIDRDTRRLIFDASELSFADSSAIALFVRLANEVPQVEIRRPPELLREIIHRMGLADRLRLMP